MGNINKLVGALSVGVALSGASCLHAERVNGLLPIEDTFFAQCHDNELDFDTRCIDFTQGYLDDAKNGVYLFNQKVEADIFGAQATVELDGICSSVLFNNGYLLTAKHCVDVELPFGIIIKEREFSVTHKGKKRALEKIALGEDVDIALFKAVDYNDLPYVPFPLGNTDSITEGNFVYLFGYTGLNEVNVRDGIVGVAEDTFLQDEFGTGHFLITNGVAPGDSGGMVIGFRDGVPEVLGILLYRYDPHAGGCLKLNRIPDAIIQYLENNQ